MIRSLNSFTLNRLKSEKSHVPLSCFRLFSSSQNYNTKINSSLFIPHAASESSNHLFGFVTFAIATTAITSCEDRRDIPSPSSPQLSKIKRATQNGTTVKKLWPGGVSDQACEDLVQTILQDPSINITLMPDKIEALIYKSTVRLVLNLFYKLLSKLDGISLLSHQIQVMAVARDQTRIVTMAKQSASVNDEVLETVAERLLANRAINSAVIPDSIEIQLYKNCLKVIFRALEILSNSFSINICGHDLSLTLSPAHLEQSALAASLKYQSSSSTIASSEVDMELLTEFALKAGVPDDGAAAELPFWDRWLSRRTLVANLNASLYGLILGILDDILQHSNIKILSDDIYFDILPGETDKKSKKQKNTVYVTKESSKLPSFAAGIGVGIGLMALLTTIIK